MYRRLILSTLLLVMVLAATCPVLAADTVDIQLTYPIGRSPKVFTAGWTFGAKAILNPGTKDSKDLSKQVKWSGSGIFSPVTGSVSHPAFSSEGANTIELSVRVGLKTYKKKFAIQAIEPDNFATLGDKAFCAGDVHGCPSCPHHVLGPITTGSSTVKINGKPVARVGDTGVHAACCGSNTFTIVSGDSNVLIDGRPAARLGDKTKHCGGFGVIIK